MTNVPMGRLDVWLDRFDVYFDFLKIFSLPGGQVTIPSSLPTQQV
jgi:hypothetical protein